MAEDTNHDRGVFEGQVLARLSSIEASCQDIKRWFTEHEARLRVVEQDVAKGKVLAALAGLIAGGVSGWLAKWLGK